MLIRMGFIQFAVWWDCDDELTFLGNNYGSNQIFYSGWESQLSRSRGKFTLVTNSHHFLIIIKKITGGNRSKCITTTY
jgi:hypothetical protein